MIIKSLKLNNFRNIESINVDLNSNINIFYGDNGQGKTNIVESLSFVSLLKSFRKADTSSLIKKDCDSLFVELIDSKNNSYKVTIENDKKHVFFNNKEIRKHSDFIGLVNIVSFIPDDVLLFKTSPKDRREYINDEISKVSPAYYQFINEYTKVKQDRNELLKCDEIDMNLLRTYSSMMAGYGIKIIERRIEFVNLINKYLNDIYQKLSSTNSNLYLKYDSNLVGKSVEEISIMIDSKLDEDRIRKQSTVGPHRDDFIMYLDDNEIAEYGSQGQNRLAVIALKLAIVQYIKLKRDDDAIIILDDVLSELDFTRKNNLFKELLNSNQLFITCTNNVAIDNSNKYEIVNGRIGGSK